MRYCGLTRIQQVGYSFFGRLTSVATKTFQVLFFSIMYNAVAHILFGVFLCTVYFPCLLFNLVRTCFSEIDTRSEQFYSFFFDFGAYKVKT